MKNLDNSCKVALESIRQQSLQLLELANRLEKDNGLMSALSLLSDTKKSGSKVVISGIGKSGHIGKKMAATLASTGTSAIFIHSTEAFHGDLGMINPEDTVVLISNSGETDEVIKLLPILKMWGNPIISICGNSESTLASHSHANISISVENEVCPNNLAPTSSTTATTVVGDALACAMMDYRSFKPVDFAKFHPGGSLGRKLLVKVGDVMKHRDALALVKPSESVVEIAKAITSRNVGCAFVVDNKDSLVGVVSDGDLRRGGVKELMDDEVPLNSLVARDIMTRNPVTIDSDDSLASASELMKKRDVKVLVVRSKDTFGCIELKDVI
ncbi:D-arabinose 5-phosphate isomerase KdsD [Vibrio chagasii]|nr:D-arabinose 5-phosphate isomerase KdsD [Vibrio chagasii]